MMAMTTSTMTSPATTSPLPGAQSLHATLQVTHGSTTVAALTPASTVVPVSPPTAPKRASATARATHTNASPITAHSSGNRSLLAHVNGPNVTSTTALGSANTITL